MKNEIEMVELLGHTRRAIAAAQGWNAAMPTLPTIVQIAIANSENPNSVKLEQNTAVTRTPKTMSVRCPTLSPRNPANGCRALPIIPESMAMMPSPLIWAGLQSVSAPYVEM